MRPLDLNKRHAILQAAQRLITRLGFEGVSVAKIAKAAGVSPATLYIYFDNKEDMINQLYIETKREMAQFILEGLQGSSFDASGDYRNWFRRFFYQHWNYFYQHPDAMAFIEQFSNSPLLAKMSVDEGASYYQPIREMLAQAQAAGVIKAVPTRLLQTVMLTPVVRLAQQHAREPVQPDELEQLFELIWSALKTT